jgi:AraC-like DNA-binding protein/glycerol uptake facilitator-like aquaporin
MKNLYQIIQIIGSMQGLFLFILLITRKENKLANKVLAVLIFLVTASLAASFVHTDNDQINDFVAITRSDMFIFSYGPLIVYYTMFLTGFKEKLKPSYFLHLCPSIILLTILALYYSYLGDWLFAPIWDESNPAALRLWATIHSLALLHLLSYVIYGIAIVNKYKKHLSGYFSHTGKIYLSWLRMLLSSILIICSLSIFQFCLHSFKDSEGILQWIISIAIILLIFLMGYFTNVQPDILNDLKDMKELNTISEEPVVEEPAQHNSIKYAKNRLSESDEKANLNRLLDYVSQQKPYLDSEINIRQLSEMTAIPSHQLSMLLSIYLEQNFYTFINKYRIEEAKQMLSAPDSKDKTILAVAFDSGFNSKSTFNTVFKKFEGITPSEFRSNK